MEIISSSGLTGLNEMMHVKHSIMLATGQVFNCARGLGRIRQHSLELQFKQCDRLALLLLPGPCVSRDTFVFRLAKRKVQGGTKLAMGVRGQQNVTLS